MDHRRLAVVDAKQALGIDVTTGKPLPGYKIVNGRVVKDPAQKDKADKSASRSLVAASGR